MRKLRFVIEKSSYPTYDFSAGFVSPSGMLRAGGYQIPTLSYSQYQPTFMPLQLSEQGIHDHLILLSKCHDNYGDMWAVWYPHKRTH